MGNDPANVIPQVAKCGTINLNVIDPGYVITGSRVPVIYGAPYQSGMSTAVTVTWNNSSGNSRGMYAAAIVIGGATATPTTSYAHLRTYNSLGLFDGSSSNIDVGTLASNGTTQASGAILSWSLSGSGIPTSYDTQKEPFILATWNGGATTAPSTLNGAATITNGVITTTGQASGTVVLASGTTYGTTGTAYLLTTSGVLPFSWTGKSTNNLTGCSIYGGSASGFYNFSIPTGTGASINHPVLIQTSSATAAQPINGWQMGVSATTGIGVNVTTAGVTGIQTAGQLTLSFGQSSGLSSTPAYLVTLNSANPCGSVMVTLIPSTRTMSRSSTSTNVLTDLASRVLTRSKKAIASMSRSAQATKTLTRGKKAIASMSLSAQATKTLALVRVARATHIRIASEVKTAYYQVVSAALAVLADYDIKTVNRAKQAIATLSRSARVSKVTNVTKRASQAVIGASQAIKAATFNRSAKATAVNSVTVSKTVLRTKRANVVAVYAISSSKSKTFTRRAIATAIALAKVAKTYTPFISHPGYVSAAVETASVKSAVKTASVSSSIETASVGSKVKTASVSSAVETASVRSSVKPLV
jgi:hypothetical protein